MNDECQSSKNLLDCSSSVQAVDRRWGFPLGGRISQERGGGGAESAGEETDGNVRFQAYSARGRSDSALGACAQALCRAEARSWAKWPREAQAHVVLITERLKSAILWEK